MKKITAFYLHGCPYCASARKAIAELVMENPAYSKVEFCWYEETEHPEVVQGHSYYYVPVLFMDKEKLYEAQPGQSYAEIKKCIQTAMDNVLQQEV